jgi:hypothetical protein
MEQEMQRDVILPLLTTLQSPHNRCPVRHDLGHAHIKNLCRYLSWHSPDMVAVRALCDIGETVRHSPTLKTPCHSSWKWTLMLRKNII